MNTRFILISTVAVSLIFSLGFSKITQIKGVLLPASENPRSVVFLEWFETKLTDADVAVGNGFSDETSETGARGFCSAVLIDSNYVLTASHCFTEDFIGIKNSDGKYYGLQIRVEGTSGNPAKRYPVSDRVFSPGAWDVERAGEQLGLERSDHPTWFAYIAEAMQPLSDFALIRLRHPVEPDVAPMKLPNILKTVAPYQPTDAETECTNCRIAGYGFGNDQIFGVLHSANQEHWLPVLLRSSSGLEFAYASGSSASMNSGETAKGDSGGAIYAHSPTGDVLLGVASTLASSASAPSTSSWALLTSSQLEWISQFMKSKDREEYFQWRSEYVGLHREKIWAHILECRQQIEKLYPDDAAGTDKEFKDFFRSASASNPITRLVNVDARCLIQVPTVAPPGDVDPPQGQ